MPCCYCSTTEREPELCTLTRTSNSVPLHWCHDERPCSGTIPYGIPWTKWSSTLQTKKEVSSELHAITQEEEWNTSISAHHHSCLVSHYTLLFM